MGGCDESVFPFPSRSSGCKKRSNFHPEVNFMADLSPPDAQVAYEKHLPTAQALALDAILAYRLDPDLALVNIKKGMAAFEMHKAEIPAHLPMIALADLESIPEVGLGVKFAAMEAEKAEPSESEVLKSLDEARAIRRTLLPIIEGLEATGNVPQGTSADIRKDRGPRDTAGDCVKLAKTFRDGGDGLKGKHSADAAMIERAAVVGTWLLQHLKTERAPNEKALPPAPAIDRRNRMATLLINRHELLRKVAYYFHGEDYDDLVPPLMSYKARPKTEPAKEEAAGTGQSGSGG
jgi:hypothetical protein